mgnify:CR=1 FL=1
MKKDYAKGLVENAHQYLLIILILSGKTTQYNFQPDSTREFMLETADCLIIHIQLHDSEG